MAPCSFAICATTGGGARTGASAHTCGDEDEVGVAEEVLQGGPGHLGCTPADVGEPAGSKAFGERFADKNSLVGLDHVQVLLVRVDRDCLRTADLHVVQPVDGVVARTAASYDDNAWLADDVIFAICHVRLQVLLTFGVS